MGNCEGHLKIAAKRAVREKLSQKLINESASRVVVSPLASLTIKTFLLKADLQYLAEMNLAQTYPLTKKKSFALVKELGISKKASGSEVSKQHSQTRRT